LVDVDAASRYLCMSVHSLYHRIGRRQIPFVKHGHTIRFDRFALDPPVRVVASLARAKAPDAPVWKLRLNVPLEIDA
jgi:hypothetical protein